MTDTPAVPQDDEALAAYIRHFETFGYRENYLRTTWAGLSDEGRAGYAALGERFNW